MNHIFKQLRAEEASASTPPASLSASPASLSALPTSASSAFASASPDNASPYNASSSVEVKAPLKSSMKKKSSFDGNLRSIILYSLAHLWSQFISPVGRSVRLCMREFKSLALSFFVCPHLAFVNVSVSSCAPAIFV